ncbi:hypothetical protein VSR50_36030 [Paraburkholderia caribensis]|nr:hypothetical protein [Paraburkholderia caribensis]
MLPVLEVPDSLAIERRSGVTGNGCRLFEKLIEHEETPFRKRRKGDVAPQIAPIFCGLQTARQQLRSRSPASRPQKSLRHTRCLLWSTTEGIDYHVELTGHYYSVSHRFAREQVDLRYTTSTVEIFHRGKRIAAHAKSDRRGAHTTLNEHMPANHQAVTGWDPQRLRNWAASIGPHTTAVIAHLLGGRQHPQQAYRTCLDVLRLAKDYGNERLEAACCRAIDLKAPGYKFIASTLKNGLDQQPSPTSVQADLPLTHANVRGPNYYH